jgi:hypothetical protein
MVTITNIQPNQTVTSSLDFPPLVNGENCCDVEYSAVCGDEIIHGTVSDVCVTPEVPDKDLEFMFGMSYIPWSLNDQRMDSYDAHGFSFIAPDTMSLASMTLHHRVSLNNNGNQYSAGDGGRVRYKLYEGCLPNLGNLIYQTGEIIFSEPLYGSRPANTEQPLMITDNGNGSFPTFTMNGNITKGQWYTAVVERTTGRGDHGSINTFVIQDENRERLEVIKGFHDLKEWQVWRRTNAGSWGLRSNHVAIFELTGTNGKSFGPGHFGEVSNNTSERLYDLSGNDQFRFCINTPYPFCLTELNLGLTRMSGSAPVLAEIKDTSGAVVFSTSINFSSNPIPSSNTGGLALNDHILRSARWRTASVPNIILGSGTKYICFSTSSNTRYKIAAARDGSESNWSNGYLINPPVDLCPTLHSGTPGSRMEVSTNGGNSYFLPTNFSNTSATFVQPAVALCAKCLP